MSKYILVAVFFIIAILEVIGTVDITGQFITMLLFVTSVFIISFFMKIRGKSFFILSLLFLGISIFLLALKNQILAEKTAIWCYIFIFEGLLISSFSSTKK